MLNCCIDNNGIACGYKRIIGNVGTTRHHRHRRHRQNASNRSLGKQFPRLRNDTGSRSARNGRFRKVLETETGHSFHVPYFRQDDRNTEVDSELPSSVQIFQHSARCARFARCVRAVVRVGESNARRCGESIPSCIPRPPRFSKEGSIQSSIGELLREWETLHWQTQRRRKRSRSPISDIFGFFRTGTRIPRSKQEGQQNRARFDHAPRNLHRHVRKHAEGIYARGPNRARTERGSDETKDQRDLSSDEI